MQNRIVDISTDDVHLSVERGFLKVSRKGEVLGKVALDDIAGLVVRGYGASFSANICARLAERNTPVVICGPDQAPASVIWPIRGHYRQGFHIQAQAVAKKTLLRRLWAELVIAKLTAQASVLSSCGKENGDILTLAKKVRVGDPENVEAQAARRYWLRLLGDDFSRDRYGGGANNALNYGYSVLRAAVARAILAAGLHPSLSIQHKSGGDALRLADDLMEPFRPYVDAIVYFCAQAAGGGDSLVLDKETKAQLVDVLSLDLEGPQGASPLQTCLDRLAQSLADVYMGERKKLELPGPPLALSIGSRR